MRTLLLACLLSGIPAQAARTTAPMDVTALTAEATVITRARVVAARTVERGYDVQTTYTLRPTQTLLGPAPSTLSLTLPGGRLDGVEVQATGVPVWHAGDEVLLFLDDGHPVHADGLLTIEDRGIVDPVGRHAAAMPLDIDAVQAQIIDALQAPSDTSVAD